MARKCIATKTDGNPCNAFSLKNSDFCAGHSGLGLAADPHAAAVQSASVRQTQAQARKRRPQDVYAEALLENADRFADRLVEIALNGDDAAALRAIEALNSRVLGRPKELVETVQKPEELQRLEDMSDEEFFELWRRYQAGEDV